MDNQVRENHTLYSVLLKALLVYARKELIEMLVSYIVLYISYLKPYMNSSLQKNSTSQWRSCNYIMNKYLIIWRIPSVIDILMKNSLISERIQVQESI